MKKYRVRECEVKKFDSYYPQAACLKASAHWDRGIRTSTIEPNVAEQAGSRAGSPSYQGLSTLKKGAKRLRNER